MTKSETGDRASERARNKYYDRAITITIRFGKLYDRSVDIIVEEKVYIYI